MIPSVQWWLSEPRLTVFLALVFLLPAVVFPRASESFLRRIETLLSRVAERKYLSVLLIFVLVSGLRIALLNELLVPNPGIHDEFSYLLMSDTFAHGRIANPSHPLWRSFETFHVLWFPAYASKYPPAQGIVLALGQLLGHPWIGVLFSAAAMAAAIVWMLQAWMPSRWAFLAGFLAAAKLCIASYWINSYWGGAVAAIGGAMALGALGRLRRKPSLPMGLLLALGVAILVNSRPYESVFFCAPMLVAVLIWFANRDQLAESRRTALRLVVLPVSAVLFFTAGAMLYYNARLTGDPADPPYAYATHFDGRAAMFLWQTAGPAPRYDNVQLAAFYDQYERKQYDRTWATFKSVFLDKLRRCSIVFLWPACWLLVPGLFFLYRDYRIRFLAGCLFAILFGYSLVVWPGPHYIAPATGAIFALLVQALRHLRTMKPFRVAVGAALSRALVLALVLDVSSLVSRRIGDPQGWGGWGLLGRADLQEALQSAPGRHVVLVRYGARHSVHEEWVYNGADIDASKVIWARDLPGEENARLLDYYRDRTIWLATPDTNQISLLRAPVLTPQREVQQVQSRPR
jgi:hypothetical protein